MNLNSVLFIQSNWKHCKGFCNTFFVNILLKWILHLLVWDMFSVKNWSWCCSRILVMVIFKLYLSALLVWTTVVKCPFSPRVSVLISLLPQPHFWAPFEYLISVYSEQCLGEGTLGIQPWLNKWRCQYIWYLYNYKGYLYSTLHIWKSFQMWDNQLNVFQDYSDLDNSVGHRPASILWRWNFYREEEFKWCAFPSKNIQLQKYFQIES